jgi:hypothetical protein
MFRHCRRSMTEESQPQIGPAQGVTLRTMIDAS